MSEARFRVSSATHEGRRRDHNEDTCFVDQEIGAFAVIDGLGGEARGEVAAAIAAQQLQTGLRRLDLPIEPRIRRAVFLANEEILREAQAQGTVGSACVLTVAVLEDDRLHYGHVGDSRLYELIDGSIRQVTRDHSPVGELVRLGQLDESEAMSHPRRNRGLSRRRFPESVARRLRVRRVRQRCAPNRRRLSAL